MGANTRNMYKARKIVEYQIWHLISLIAITIVIHLYLSNNPEVLSGHLSGIATKTWFWLSIAIPVIHQIYVWLVWRLELYQSTFTKRFGLKISFNMYVTGFSALFVSRLITLIILAYSNKDTLNMKPNIAYALVLLITPLVI